MRVGLDATPLLGTRTGIGRYTASLLDALAVLDAEHPGRDQLVATAFTLRGRLAGLPPGVEVRARPVPARGLQEAWARTALPPVEWLTGRLDVFHATNFVLPPARRAGGVVTVHDLAFLRMTATVSAASARYRDLVPRSVRRAQVVITPSEAVADQLREAYAPRVPVLAVPHGVDPAWSAPAPPPPPGLPAEYVVFVGTLEPRKDLRTLLAAHRLLPGAPPLVLVGPPGWGEQVDVADCVTTGFLPDGPLRAVVAGARALVLPSRDEGFGLPVLEALAAGTPVLASDLPVLREVGGAHVRYAAAGDPEAFAEGLRALLDDPPDPAAGAAHAAAHSWRRSAEGHRSAYTLARAAV